MDLEQNTTPRPMTSVRPPRRYSMWLLGIVVVVLLGLVMLHSVNLAIGIALVGLAGLFLGKKAKTWFTHSSHTTEPPSASVSHDSLGSERSKAAVHSPSPNDTVEPPYVALGQPLCSHTPTPGEAETSKDRSSPLPPV